MSFTPEQAVDAAAALLEHLRQGRVVDRLVCKSGLRMSVQASSGHYCTPRDDAGPWRSVEVGYPTMPDSRGLPVRSVPERLAFYGSERDATPCIFGWVPVEVVLVIILENGGLA